MLRNFILSTAPVCAGFAGHASTLVSDFESSDDGWASAGFSSSLAMDGGRYGTGDGYFSLQDANTTFGTIANTTKFAGDLSAFCGASLSFNFAQFVPDRQTNSLSGFGNVTLAGSGGSVSADIVPVNPTPTWQSVTVAFDEAIFGGT